MKAAAHTYKQVLKYERIPHPYNKYKCLTKADKMLKFFSFIFLSVSGRLLIVRRTNIFNSKLVYSLKNPYIHSRKVLNFTWSRWCILIVTFGLAEMLRYWKSIIADNQPFDCTTRPLSWKPNCTWYWVAPVLCQCIPPTHNIVANLT